MSDRGRVLLVVGAVVLVAGGAAFWFFKIFQPKQQLKAAQEEIAEWETRYQDARDCLLGKSPGSAKTSEALAIREDTVKKHLRNAYTKLGVHRRTQIITSAAERFITG